MSQWLTSPNYWGYKFQQIFGGDSPLLLQKISKKRTFTNPWVMSTFLCDSPLLLRAACEVLTHTHLCTSSETRFTPQCSCGSTPNWPGSTGRKTGSTHWMEMIYIYIYTCIVYIYIYIYVYKYVHLLYYIILYCIILYYILLYYIILYIKLYIYIYLHIVYYIYICSPTNQDLLLSIFHWLFHCKGQPSAICLSAYLLWDEGDNSGWSEEMMIGWEVGG